MTRKRILGTLALLSFGITALDFAATPLPTVRQTLPVDRLEQAHDTFLPNSVVVRGFDVSLPVGMDVIDQRAEVMFDN